MKLDQELRGDCLVVSVGGVFDSRAAREGLSQLLEAAQARAVRRLLIDGRGLTSVVSIADRYDLATQLANQADGKMIVAVVVNPENMFTKTLEDTAANRGLRLKTTPSIEEARSFLGLES